MVSSTVRISRIWSSQLFRWVNWDVISSKGARIFIRATSGCNAFHTSCIQHTKNQYMVFLLTISYTMLLLNYVILWGGMTYYLILYILFHNHLIRLRECLGKWTTSLVWMWCGTSWNGYKMIQTLGHLTVSLWTQHPVFQKQHILRCSTWKGISRSLAKFFVAISSGWSNSSRVCFIFRLVPWWFPAA